MKRKGQIDLKIFFLALVFFFLRPSSALSKELVPQVVFRSPAPQAPSLAAPVSSRPRMVFVPRWGVYYAPDLSYNLFRFNKTWFYYYEGKWYKSRAHDGPWRYVPFSNVPERLKNLPEEFIKKENKPPSKKAKPARKRSSKKKGRKKKKELSFLSAPLLLM